MTRKQIKSKFPDLTPTQRRNLRKAQTQATKTRRVAAGKPARPRRHYSTRSKPCYSPIGCTSRTSRIVANGACYERDAAGQGVIHG